MIIEFLGVSGVGKTTVAKKYKEMLECEGKEVVWDTFELYEKCGWITRNIHKAAIVAIYATCHRKWVREYYAHLIDNIPNKHERIKPLFNAVFLKALLHKAKGDNKMHIFDEGSLQYLWAIKLRGNSSVTRYDVDMSEYFFGLPDRLISVNADAEKIAMRIEQRGEYVKIIDYGDLKNTIKRMQKQQQIIVSEIQNRIEIVEYDN